MDTTVSSDRPDEQAPLIPAAQYIRMSTEHQQYSTKNQADAITKYAQERGYELRRTYTDGGRTGVVISGRIALQQLIADVQRGDVDFRTILVYDVSRWGRFQDVDESAHYEYLCKKAGVRVEYCAEQFENDGSTQTALFKSVKRVMAGEFSRELSAKVFRGQCNLIQLGYRQGGPAGFGLRRMLIAMTGEPKTMLRLREKKSLQTDRVILVPGPDEEVGIVRKMFELFTQEGKHESDIAAFLNTRGTVTDLGRPWTRAAVRQVLTNEKYIGNNVFNRVSFKLKQKRVHNPPEAWVRAEKAFEPIVDPELFYTAQGIMLERNRRYTDEEMVELLKQLIQRNEHVSAHMIDEADGMPSSAAYRSRFGGLIRAYNLAGYDPDRDFAFLEINRRLRALHPSLSDQAVRRLKQVGASVDLDEQTNHLRINGEYSTAIVLSRCRRSSSGTLRWVIRLHSRPVPDIALMVRMNPDNEEPSDFYMLPLFDMVAPDLRLGQWNAAYIDAYRHDTLERFTELAVRTRLRSAL